MKNSRWFSPVTLVSSTNKTDLGDNMRQAQPVWRTKSYNFKRKAWEGNVLFFFKYFLKFRSFYLRRSSVKSFVERDFFIRILFQVYFDFA